MRRSPIAVAITALLLCVPLVGASAAPAAPKKKLPASGTITLVSNTVESTKQAGGNTTIEAVAVVDFAGTLDGPAVEPYFSTTHANGKTQQRGRGTFTGTVAGRTGTIFYVFHGDATSGVISITGGTGGLEGAHGKLAYELTSPTPAVFDYTGTVWFT